MKNLKIKQIKGKERRRKKNKQRKRNHQILNFKINEKCAHVPICILSFILFFGGRRERIEEFNKEELSRKKRGFEFKQIQNTGAEAEACWELKRTKSQIPR